MKHIITVASLIASLSLLQGAEKPSATQAALTAKTIATMQADIDAKPSRVLYAVEDALVMSEASACEIVKTAIELTSADAKLVGDIVYTAVSKAPAMSAVIVDCAVKCSPDSSNAIKKALQRALGEDTAAAAEGSGKGVASSKDEATGKQVIKSGKEVTGKQPVPVGKEPAPVAPEEEFMDFGLQRPGVGGIYFATPSAGGGGRTPREPEDNTDDDKPRRPNRPPGGISPAVMDPDPKPDPDPVTDPDPEKEI